MQRIKIRTQKCISRNIVRFFNINILISRRKRAVCNWHRCKNPLRSTTKIRMGGRTGKEKKNHCIRWRVKTVAIGNVLKPSTWAKYERPNQKFQVQCTHFFDETEIARENRTCLDPRQSYPPLNSN
ncbi:hypothetical protein NPIL_245921 [Nephila pilipes]|uniref:Uncharacterized protein n=1 Tax=Nephila pilipes TaxID=299642 RepID=A0A8X6MDL0_NEPPI|nr:hypothetical protein NPIL_245921 [Nephila pilipes]